MFNKINLFFIAIFLFGASSAQNKTAMKYARTITEKDLKKHLTIIASDEYEGRETGEEGQKKAAKYISDYFRKQGLEPPVKGSFLQKFELTRSVLSNDSSYLKKGNDKKKLYDDFLYYSNVNTEGEEKISVVLYDKSDSLSSEYKDAFLLYKTKKLLNVQEMFKIASKVSARGVWVVFEENEKEYNSIRTFAEINMKKGSLGIEKRKNTGNVFLIVKQETVTWVYGKKLEDIQPKEKASVSMKIAFEEEKVPTENVLGYIKGSEKSEETLVITAHYDHVGIINGEIHNGADDDGSGTVTVLELVEAFSTALKKNHTPKRSILFMTVTGEEKGLLGSQYYTDFDPIFPLKTTIANLNIDMVGRVDEKHQDTPNYIYLIGADKLSKELHDLSEQCNTTYTHLELDYTYNDENDPNRFYYRSDHYNFAKNKIPIIFYFNGVHADYHKPTDTVEKINFTKMTKIAKFIFHTAWELANREEMLKLD